MPVTMETLQQLQFYLKGKLNPKLRKWQKMIIELKLYNGVWT